MSDDNGGQGPGADIEVAWVDAGSQQRAAVLDGVGDVAFEDAGPVREFPSYRRQRYFPGMWWLATTGRHVGFESWLERDLIRTIRRVIKIADCDRIRSLNLFGK